MDKMSRAEEEERTRIVCQCSWPEHLGEKGSIDGDGHMRTASGEHVNGGDQLRFSEV